MTLLSVVTLLAAVVLLASITQAAVHQYPSLFAIGLNGKTLVGLW